MSDEDAAMGRHLLNYMKQLRNKKEDLQRVENPMCSECGETIEAKPGDFLELHQIVEVDSEGVWEIKGETGMCPTCVEIYIEVTVDLITGE